MNWIYELIISAEYSVLLWFVCSCHALQLCGWELAKVDWQQWRQQAKRLCEQLCLNGGGKRLANYPFRYIISCLPIYQIPSTSNTNAQYRQLKCSLNPKSPTTKVFCNLVTACSDWSVCSDNLSCSSHTWNETILMRGSSVNCIVLIRKWWIPGTVLCPVLTKSLIAS